MSSYFHVSYLHGMQYGGAFSFLALSASPHSHVVQLTDIKTDRTVEIKPKLNSVKAVSKLFKNVLFQPKHETF